MLLAVCRSWPCAVTSGCSRSPGSAAGFIARLWLLARLRGGGAFQMAMDLQERAEEIDRENPVPTPTEPRSRLKRSSGGSSGVGDQGLVNRSARRRVALAVRLFPKTFLSHGNEALLACPGRPRDRRVAAVSTPGKRRPVLARSSLMGQQWPTRSRVWGIRHFATTRLTG